MYVYVCKVNDMYVKLWYNQIRMIWKTKKTPTRESKGQLVGLLVGCFSSIYTFNAMFPNVYPVII